MYIYAVGSIRIVYGWSLKCAEYLMEIGKCWGFWVRIAEILES